MGITVQIYKVTSIGESKYRGTLGRQSPEHTQQSKDRWFPAGAFCLK
jgi:hypothetical protein